MLYSLMSQEKTKQNKTGITLATKSLNGKALVYRTDYKSAVSIGRAKRKA